MGWALGLGLLASVALVGANPSSGHAAITTDQPATATQVAVITVDPADGLDQLPANLAYALDTAEFRTDEDPSNLAPPYVIRSTGRVVAPVTSAADSNKVAYAANAIGIDPSTLPDDGSDDGSASGTTDGKEETAATATATTFYYPSTPVVKYSKSELTAVKGDVLNSGVPGVENLWAAFIDAETNRVLVKATAVTEEMRTALASRYAADKVALLLTDEQPPSLLSRDNDSSPFWGGAYTITTTGGGWRWDCTIGFPWDSGGVAYFITAGHCTGLNNSVYMPRYGSDAVGVVVKDGWNNVTGSVKIDGQSYNTGDIALVKLNAGYGAGVSMYTGSRYSSQSRVIGPVWSRAPKRGDRLCSGGQRTGEQCRWMVTAVSVDIRYVDGELIRNATWATKGGTCLVGGDSGGPVYTVRSNGRVAPRGIISGGNEDCGMAFSDIRVAEKSLPGAVKYA